MGFSRNLNYKLLVSVFLSMTCFQVGLTKLEKPNLEIIQLSIFSVWSKRENSFHTGAEITIFDLLGCTTELSCTCKQQNRKAANIQWTV